MGQSSFSTAWGPTLEYREPASMRNTLCLLLAAAGLAWLAVFLTRRGCRSYHNPTREAERLLDRCRDLLDGIESAARDLEEPRAPTA